MFDELRKNEYVTHRKWLALKRRLKSEGDKGFDFEAFTHWRVYARLVLQSLTLKSLRNEIVITLSHRYSFITDPLI